MKQKTLSILLQKPVKTPDINIYQFLLRRPKINSSPVLCIDHQQRLTLSELKTESLRYACALAEYGVRRGDIVPICSEPSIEAVIMFFALNRLGAVSTFFNNTANHTEINEYIRQFRSRVLLLSQRTADRLQLNGLSEIEAEGMIILPSDNAYGRSIPGAAPLSSLFKDSQAQDIRLDGEGKNAPAHISYTSGSTGQPKAILLTNENIIAEIISLRKATMMQLGPKKNSLQVVPFNYPYGFIVSTLLPMFCGKPTALTPTLTLNNISQYIDLYKPCYINGIPAFYKALLRDPAVQEMDLSYIRYPVTGGDTLDIHTEKAINAFLQSHGSKGTITNGCGNGEGCGSLLNPASVLHKYVPESCGRPFPGLSVKLIDDETGQPVPLGESGRFCFSGTNLMKGYYSENGSESTPFVFDEQGRRWFYTDTFMHMNADYWMFMDGRERRFFITFDEQGSPYKVYCDHVQKIIMQAHPAIIDCAVVQRADPIRSYVPIAFICLNDPSQDRQSVLEETEKHCLNNLQHCALPAEYHFLDELPLTVAGKIDYTALEEMVNHNKIRK